MQPVRHSFGTKVFFFVAVLVILLTGFISGKNSLFLQEMMKRQYQSSLIDTTQLQGNRISNILGRWDTKLTFFMQAMERAAPAEKALLIESFHLSENDLRAVQFLGGKSNSEYFSFDKVDLKLSVDEVNKLGIAGDISIVNHPRIPETMLLVRRFKMADNGEQRLVVVFFRLSRLLLEKSDTENVKFYLVDRSLRNLGNRRAYKNILLDKKFAKKAESVLRGELGAGYLGELNQLSDRYYVAYIDLSPYPLKLIVHQKVNIIEGAIRSFFTEMIQWTLLFLLVAIFFASIMIRGLLKNLNTLIYATEQVARGNLKVSVPVKSQDEFGRLAFLFNWMTKKIAELLNDEREKVRLEAELSTAQTVQNTFFPTDQIMSPALNIEGYYKPASECGGDLWGHIKLKGGMELIFIGDATGHGAPAALVTALAYATINIYSASFDQGLTGKFDPSIMIQNLNKLLFDTLNGRICMSILVMLFDKEKSTLSFCNAGHTFPYLIPKDPNDIRLENQVKKRVYKTLSGSKKSSGIVGIDPQAVFMTDYIGLQDGDRFVLYTDGLTEASNKDKKLWGSRHLQKIFDVHHADKALNLKKKVVDQVIEFNETKEQFTDDVTLLIIDFRQEAENYS